MRQTGYARASAGKGLAGLRRRRSDRRGFIQTDVKVDRVADEIFARYSGEIPVEVEGCPYKATFFRPEYCPDLRVMKLVGRHGLYVNRRAVKEASRGALEKHPLRALRVSIEQLMLAALMHDLGKHHEDIYPLIKELEGRDLRGSQDSAAADRNRELLAHIREGHTRKGPEMVERLRDAGRPELDVFVLTVSKCHGYDYAKNAADRIWWAREINMITLADDYDAMMSQGPERRYKKEPITQEQAVHLLQAGVKSGRYERRITEIFIKEVLRVTKES